MLLQLHSLSHLQTLHLSLDHLNITSRTLELVISMTKGMHALKDLALKVECKEGLTREGETNIRDVLSSLKDSSLSSLALSLSQSDSPHLLLTQVFQGLASLSRLEKLSLDFKDSKLLLSHIDYF